MAAHAEQLRFKKGWDRFGSTQIYVSRGIGTIVLPWRFRCPAEIPHLSSSRTTRKPTRSAGCPRRRSNLSPDKNPNRSRRVF